MPRAVSLTHGDWTRQLRPAERAVFFTDRASGANLDLSGAPGEPVCFVCDEVTAAAVFARDFVARYPHSQAEVYDTRGLGLPPLARIVAESVAHRERSIETWRPVAGSMLWAIGLTLGISEAQHDFSRMWPMLIAVKCCVLGTVMLGTAAHRRFSKPRIDND